MNFRNWLPCSLLAMTLTTWTLVDELHAAAAAAKVTTSPKMTMEPLTEQKGWLRVPEYLKGATISTKPLNLDSQKPGSQVVRIESEGIVLLAATRNLEPSRVTAVDRDAMEKVGWMAVGDLLYRENGQLKEMILFRRTIPTGAQLEFKPKAYTAPRLLTIDGSHAAKIAGLTRRTYHYNEFSELLKLPTTPAKSTSAKMDPFLLETNDTTAGSRYSVSLLERELIRQSILLIAREEFGLTTRDRSLREAFPDSGAATVIPWQVALNASDSNFFFKDLNITVFQTANGIPVPLWERRIVGSKKRVEEQTTQIELLSRKELAEVFVKQGYSRRPARPVPPITTTLPLSLQNRLNELNFIAQFDAIRQLHALAIRDGESAAVLSGLAQGYAQLGTLTECLWSPANKVFKARALLYAERLVAREGERPEGFWTRGFVRALVGLHATAIADLDRAEELAKQVKGVRPTAPAWVAAIRAHCEFDTRKLADAEKNKALRPLVCYLRLLQVEFSPWHEIHAQASRKMLEAVPDNFRALDLLYKVTSQETDLEAREQQVSAFETGLYRRLPQISDLPADVRKYCQSQPTTIRKASVPETKPFGSRSELLTQMAKANKAARDRKEPSLNVLESLIREVQFLQSWRYLNAGYSDAEEIEFQASLVKGHPFAAFLMYDHPDSEKDLKARDTLAQTIRLWELEPTEAEILVVRSPKTLQPQFLTYLVAVYDRPDYIYRDQSVIYQVYRSQGRTTNIPVTQTRTLKAISPHSPMAIMADLLTDEKLLDEQGLALEKRFIDDWEALRRLAVRYSVHNRPADAARCCERSLKLKPLVSTAIDLASYYKKQDDIPKWKRTLEQALTLTTDEIEQATIQMNLAAYYMKTRDWNQALPYARKAAEAGTDSTLRNLAYCYEGMQKWTDADQCYRKLSERDENAFDWFLWCRRTGHGSPQTAQSLCLEYLKDYGDDLPPSMLPPAACFEMLRGRLDKALERCTTGITQTRDVWCGLTGIVIAQRLGKFRERDILLNQVIACGEVPKGTVHAQGDMIALAGLIKKACANTKNPRLDVAECEKLFKVASSGELTNVRYFAGTFLVLTGQKEAGIKFLQAAATAPINRVTRTLAVVTLREGKIKIGPTRDKE